MKRKGFTLIELLSVIIILGVIALIAIPVIISVIDKMKISSVESSCKGYIKAFGDKLVSDQYDGPVVRDGYYDVKNIDLGDKAKGEMPEEGWVQVTNSEANKAELKFGKYIVECTSLSAKVDISKKEIDDKGPTIDLDKNVVYLDPTNLQNACSDFNSVSKTETKTGCMKWYIYGEAGKNYKLILAHNTTARIKWNDSNSNVEYGESNVKSAVDDLIKTNKWVVIPRLITAQEVANITNNTSWTDSGTWYCFGSNTKDHDSSPYCNKDTNKTYSWIFDNLNGCTTYGCTIEDNNSYTGVGTAENGTTNGYWTSTPAGTAGTGSLVWRVRRNGYMGSTDANGSGVGIRPVIEVPKSLFDSKKDPTEPSNIAMSITANLTPSAPINGYVKKETDTFSFIASSEDGVKYYVKSSTDVKITSGVALQVCGNSVSPRNCEMVSTSTLNAGKWYEVNDTLTVSFDKQMDTPATLYATSYDGFEFKEAITRTTNKIDGIIPTTEIKNVTTDPAGNGYVNSLTLELESHDNVSDSANILYSYDNGSTWTSTNTKTYTANGEYKIYAKDEFGNINKKFCDPSKSYEAGSCVCTDSECKFVVNSFDTEPPVCGTYSGESTSWTNQNRTIYLTCIDAKGGCEQETYSKTFSSTTKVGSWSVTIKDKSGNETTCSKDDLNVYVDKQAPSISLAISTFDSPVNVNNVFNKSVGESGLGSFSCNYSTLNVQAYDPVTCTLTNGAGASVTKNFKVTTTDVTLTSISHAGATSGNSWYSKTFYNLPSSTRTISVGAGGMFVQNTQWHTCDGVVGYTDARAYASASISCYNASGGVLLSASFSNSNSSGTYSIGEGLSYCSLVSTYGTGSQEMRCGGTLTAATSSSITATLYAPRATITAK